MSSRYIIDDIQHCISHEDHQLHFHHTYQILFVMKGASEITFSHTTQIVREESIIFLRNLEQHAVHVIETPYHGYVLHLNPLLTDQNIIDSKLLSILKVRPASFCNHINISRIFSTITSLFEQMLSEFKHHYPYKRELLIQLVNQLLIQIWRLSPDSFPMSALAENETIFQIQTYIETNYLQDISITNLAQQFYLSPSYLSHNFKNMTGFSPKQYLMLLRLSHSKSLLQHSDDSISNIAYKSGFSDINNYIKYYKHYFDETPSATRKRKKDAKDQ
ncbi:MAG: AraC family transcriptional regulator [Lachnospiraceae bacterium]|nr:AraC family transcriptional regulator [Lachnospiraceae bacterium]